MREREVTKLLQKKENILIKVISILQSC